MHVLNWIRSGTLTYLRRGSLLAKSASYSGEPAARTMRAAETVSGDFFHNGASVHCLCHVEQQQGPRLSLRVVAEIGTVSLLGLRKGTQGHIEINNLLLPFRVAHVDLPCVEVITASQQARPAHRQLLRVPASFLVRLRRKGSTGLWVSGQGVDLSTGGCRFRLIAPIVPKIRDAYAVDMLILLPDGSEERLLLDTQVRWVRPTSSSIYVGMEALHPAQRKALTNAAVQFQHALARRPEDYLLVRS